MIEEIKRDPTKHFQHPQEVLKNDYLSAIDKEVILLNWLDQINQLSCAYDEGMDGDSHSISMLAPVKKALSDLRAYENPIAV